MTALLRRVPEVEKATLVTRVPRAHEYLFELKYDGYRIVAVKAGDDVRLLSRKRQDWTTPFAEVARAIAKAIGRRAREAIVDGELCALDPRGVPSFNRLQNWMTRRRGEVALAYVAFDLVWLDGRDLRRAPIEERRAALASILGRARGGVVSIASAASGDPAHLLRLAAEHGFEGLVAKRKGSTYEGGRSRDWLKLKVLQRQELAVVGYLPLEGHRDAVGSLLLARVDEDGAFRYAGKVGTGFDQATRIALAKELDRDRTTAPQARGMPRIAITRWSRPRLVAEVTFGEWTPEGRVRHPSFVGLRRDKCPDECVLERPRDERGKEA